MSDDVRRIEFRPDAPSGHCRRKTSQRDKVSSTSCRWWALESKTIHGAPSTCAWCQDTSGSMRKLKVVLGCRCVTRRRPTNNYHEHPAVKRNPNEDMFPVALHMDAVPYSLTDSVVGIWLFNLWSRQRHPMCIVRKRIVCQCGCREWCMYYTVSVFVEWCLRCLADGVPRGWKAISARLHENFKDCVTGGDVMRPTHPSLRHVFWYKCVTGAGAYCTRHNAAVMSQVTT